MISRWPQVYSTLLKDIENIDVAHEGVDESFDHFRHQVTRVLGKPDDDWSSEDCVQETLTQVLSSLTIHCYDALTNDIEYFARLIQVLVAATRSFSTWRTYFGYRVPSSSSNQDGDWESIPSDCVLDVARRVCTLHLRVPSPVITDALRIIANCCADNNKNRAVVIQRNGIETVLRLIQYGADLNALIPALYNICVDYDEPARFLPALDIDSIGLVDLSLEDKSGDDAVAQPQSGKKLSRAVEDLAAAHRSNDEFSTFELLLSQHWKVSEAIRAYLAELIEMSTQPALCGFSNVCSQEHWSTGRKAWSCSVNSTIVQLDTIALAVEFGRRDPECLSHISRAMLNLLTTPGARDALLQRQDESIWTLMTLACHDEDFNAEDESFDEELGIARKEFLKILYQITGEASFSTNGLRVKALLEASTDELESYTISDRRDAKGQRPKLSTSSRPIVLASACVILSQLCASEPVREGMVVDQRLVSSLVAILQSEQEPDVLYPAITIVARTALTSPQELDFITIGGLQHMQRLLTTGGLGLVVPFETITAYKNIVHQRPAVINLLMTPSINGKSIFEDVFNLWDLTVEAGTKLEIGKFFLEILRTILPIKQNSGSPAAMKHANPIITEFELFLHKSCTQVSEVFVWLCTKAEPPAQRDHGWFGLAMLSIWSVARLAIFKTIERQQEFRDAVREASQLQNGAVRNNLMLLLTKLRGSATEVEIDDGVRDTLQSAAENLNMGLSFQVWTLV